MLYQYWFEITLELAQLHLIKGVKTLRRALQLRYKGVT